MSRAGACLGVTHAQGGHVRAVGHAAPVVGDGQATVGVPDGAVQVLQEGEEKEGEGDTS